MKENIIIQAFDMSNKELAGKYADELSRSNLLSLNLALTQAENEKLKKKIKELEDLLDQKTNPSTEGEANEQ